MSTYIDGRIRIDGDIYEIGEISTGGYLPLVCEGRKEWHLVRNRDEADRATLRYWQEMDAKEVVCLVGADAIVEMWTRGTTLEEWVADLDAAEQWASYDGSESEVTPPTPAERSRACLIRRLKAGEVIVGDGGNVGVREGLYTYWLVEEDGGLLGTRFLDGDADGNAVAGDPSDVADALASDEIALFCAGWDSLVEELGFTPTIAYRHN